MSVVAALVESRDAVTFLRRSLPRGGPRLVSCRSLAGLQRQFTTRVIEVVVLSPRHHLWPAAWPFIDQHFPHIGVLLYGSYRVDDGDLLTRCLRAGVAGVAVQGVDDAVVGDLAVRVSLAARRREALAHAPRLLNLTEPLQLEVWHTVLAEADRPLRTDELARGFGVSREHLSRQFAAGGAPNLKRVLDLVRVVCAGQLLGNPGYRQADVARLLHFSSASHLGRTTRRVADVSLGRLPALEPAEVLTRFVRGHTRSRL